MPALQGVRLLKRVIVCLGATAAKALLGPDFRITQMRGQFVQSPMAPFVFATFHPSALLRLKGEEERAAAFDKLVDDLSLIRRAFDKAP